MVWLAFCSETAVSGPEDTVTRAECA